MKYIKYILSTISLISAAYAAKDGKCGKGVGSCPEGFCCSQFGYCGKTADHCGKGCQSAFGICETEAPTTGQCGKGLGNCPEGQCCSKYGYCGIDVVYCGTGCQPAYGICNNTPIKKTTTTVVKKTTTKKTTKKPTKKTTTTTTKSSKPTNNEKISTNGQCGDVEGKCPNNECCSQYGYCGTTDDYCGVGCQSAFGRCGNAQKPTTTTTTRKVKPTSTGKISTNGLCGDKDGICPDGQCCSQYGYCGISADHCLAGCQSAFGECGQGVIDENTVQGFAYYDSCVNKKDWALTFDDGPYEFDNYLLDLLKKKGVKATFFINGDNASNIREEKYKKIIQRMNNEGHIVASHTWSHVDIAEVSNDKLIEEMTKLDTIIKQYIGKKPAFMRPPYGSGNGNGRVAKTLKSLGYSAACMWNVDTMDWDNKGDKAYALNEFKNYVKKGKQGILSLNHNFYQNISKDSLVNLIEAEIDYMISQGYRPVTMDKCLGLKAYQ